jgi:predicted nucleic acid-binding protein
MPHPRLVVDTNIFVPGLVGVLASPPGRSASAGLIRAWRGERCTLIVSEPLLEEYWRVLQRPPFGVARRNATRLRDVIRSRAVVVVPDRDPDDNVVLLTAVRGRADMLVTDNTADFAELASGRMVRRKLHNRELRYRGARVVSLSECLDEIRAMHADADRIMRRRTRW